MTLTQVSTWFANARRRLKKENKMTWERNPDDTEVNVDDDGKSDNLVFKKATLSGLTALRVETSSLNVTHVSSTR